MSEIDSRHPQSDISVLINFIPYDFIIAFGTQPQQNELKQSQEQLRQRRL